MLCRLVVSLVEAGVLEALARWTAQQLRRSGRQRSAAVKDGVAAAAPIFVKVLWGTCSRSASPLMSPQQRVPQCPQE